MTHRTRRLNQAQRVANTLQEIRDRRVTQPDGTFSHHEPGRKILEAIGADILRAAGAKKPFMHSRGAQFSIGTEKRQIVEVLICGEPEEDDHLLQVFDIFEGGRSAEFEILNTRICNLKKDDLAEAVQNLLL